MRIWTHIGVYFIFISLLFHMGDAQAVLFDWFSCFTGSTVLHVIKQLLVLFYRALKNLFMHFFYWIIVLEHKLAVYWRCFLLSVFDTYACAHTLHALSMVMVCSLELFLHSHSFTLKVDSDLILVHLLSHCSVLNP